MAIQFDNTIQLYNEKGVMQDTQCEGGMKGLPETFSEKDFLTQVAS